MFAVGCVNLIGNMWSRKKVPRNRDSTTPKRMTTPKMGSRRRKITKTISNSKKKKYRRNTSNYKQRLTWINNISMMKALIGPKLLRRHSMKLKSKSKSTRKTKLDKLSSKPSDQTLPIDSSKFLRFHIHLMPLDSRDLWISHISTPTGI